MKKVFVLTALLLIGLTLSQVLPGLFTDYSLVSHIIKLGTMLCLSFIMIHVGYEFEIQKNQMRTYGYDYVVAFTAATFPWIFVTLYFVYVLMPESIVGWESWKQSLLAARFAAPTSAGVLFSMLAAAGLAATWMFRKTRILAIFDDLDTVLLMIPLQMLIIGFRWQLLIIVFVMGLLLWLAWRYLHSVNMSITWKSVFLYAVGITAVAELVYFSSKLVDEVVPVHIEVLLPAFVLGTVISKAFNKVDTTAMALRMFSKPDGTAHNRTTFRWFSWYWLVCLCRYLAVRQVWTPRHCKQIAILLDLTLLKAPRRWLVVPASTGA
jgi:hypothetical protein